MIRNKMRVLFQKKNTFQSAQGGFLMIELIVALFIFAFVMTMSIGSLVTALDANRKVQSLKSVFNNLEVAMDTMTKTLAAGRAFQCAEDREDDFVFTNTDQPDWCTTEDPAGHTAISFVSNENLDNDASTRDALVYRFNSPATLGGTGPGFLERKRYQSTDNGITWQAADTEWIRLTAPEVNITEVKFYIHGTQPFISGDTKQPRVTINVKGEAGAGPRAGITTFAVQTTVTQLIPDF